MADTPNNDDCTASARLAGVLERLEPSLNRIVKIVEREQRSAGVWRIVKRAAFVLIFIVCGLMYLGFYGAILGVQPTLSKPTVAVVDVTGEIGGNNLASADRLVPLIDNLCRQSEVRALVLHINSPGGSPGDAERIGAAIDRCKLGKTHDGKSQRRPVLAVADGMAASAAYMIAIHADKIIANPTGMVGSIGIIAEGLKYPDLLHKVGVTAYQYTSGSLKATLSPYSTDTPAQQKLVQELVDEDMQVFKADVIQARPKLKLDTPDLWSGRIWVANQALKIGLIDQVGILEDVLAHNFPKLAVQRFAPARNFRDALSVQTWVNAFVADAFDHEMQIK